MKLIDAGLLLDNLSGRLESMKDYDAVKDVINNMQTAYDVDKVVEQLEEAKEKIASEDYCRNMNEKESCSHKDCYKCCAEHLIEIVKGGGVDDK